MTFAATANAVARAGGSPNLSPAGLAEADETASAQGITELPGLDSNQQPSG